MINWQTNDAASDYKNEIHIKAHDQFRGYCCSLSRRKPYVLVIRAIADFNTGFGTRESHESSEVLINDESMYESQRWFWTLLSACQW